jgi:hypothetical protein
MLNRKPASFTDRFAAAAALLGALAIAAGPAAADTVANGGNLFLSQSQTGSGTVTGLISDPATSPGNYYYHDSWTAPQTTTVGSTGYGFFDDFVFTIGANQVDSITSTISLGSFVGISNMRVRLYKAPSGLASLTTGAPAAGSAIDAWSSTVAFPGGTSTVDVLPTTILTAGTYTLEVEGTVTGDPGGGNFTGSLNLTPVPLPAALPLLFSGLGGFGLFARRRKLRTA